MKHLTGNQQKTLSPVAAVSQGLFPQPLAMTNTSKYIVTAEQTLHQTKAKPDRLGDQQQVQRNSR